MFIGTYVGRCWPRLLEKIFQTFGILEFNGIYIYGYIIY